MSLLLAAKGRKAAGIPVFTSQVSGVSTPQTATVTFKSDGTVTRSGGIPANWYQVTTPAIGNDYEVYAELTSGVGLTGTFDTWLPLSSSQSWSLSNSDPGEVTATILFSLRKNGGPYVIDTGTITLVAEVIV